VARRSVMTLFSAPLTRGVTGRAWCLPRRESRSIGQCRPRTLPEDLLDLNPYHSVPTLVDRDLVLYDSRVIIEYLDERFPHPPLMPIDPVTRAQFRVALYRVERDWYAWRATSSRTRGARPRRTAARCWARRSAPAPRCSRPSRFFLSDEFSLVDASIAPILWRLPLRHRAAGAGAADREVHECDLLRARRFAPA
jgi:stringent starvation protein A